jgi:hypothetical protein
MPAIKSSGSNEKINEKSWGVKLVDITREMSQAGTMGMKLEFAILDTVSIANPDYDEAVEGSRRYIDVKKDSIDLDAVDYYPKDRKEDNRFVKIWFSPKNYLPTENYGSYVELKHVVDSLFLTDTVVLPTEFDVTKIRTIINTLSDAVLDDTYATSELRFVLKDWETGKLSPQGSKYHSQSFELLNEAETVEFKNVYEQEADTNE